MQLSGQAVEIMDVTLRDGEQTQGISFNAREKLHIAKSLLEQLKVDRIEIASARISDGEREAVQNIADWATSNNLLERIEVLGFVDHKKSVDWIKEAGAQVMNLLTKGSENHCRRQLRKTLQEHVADICKTADYAHEQGITINAYLEDWSNGYLNSPDYVYEMMELLKNSGIKHFMLPDTLGVMSPEEVFDSLQDMLNRFPWAHFDFHPHNDYGLGTANALAAVRAGVRSIHCTVNCLGERAGNASLPEIAVALKDKLGVQVSLDESHFGPISELVAAFSGKRISSNAPIVGEDVFTQTSGIHADGDKKGGLYENALHPERFGRIRSYALGKMSGKASLSNNLDQLGLKLSPENFQKVLDRIVELGDRKEAITTTDLPFIITEVLENDAFGRIRLMNCTISSGWHLRATASIALKVDDADYLATGEGDGGYDAFMAAIKKILKKKKIECPKLLDYEIRIPKGGQTDALTEASITWEGNKGKNVKTIGVDTDQVLAAVRATIKMLNLKIAEISTDSTQNLKVVSR
ncbi:MAG: 2-isopropylmalate synthase [SAR324 cluster bacterium]|nr:2-isopropylmalate synthase [SAR324 cluster bacterium]